MSTAVEPTTLAGFVPARELPNGEPFYTELGLFPFQVDGMLSAYDQTARGDGGTILVYDLGIGKTIIAICLAAYLFHNGDIDQVMVICEKNKRDDWTEEIERYSVLSSMLYHGTGRQRRLERRGIPHALVTTYETARVELMAIEREPGQRGRGKAVDGPLVDKLGLRDKRTLWILDEPTKIKNRGSGNHRALDYILRQLRATSHRQRVVGLTGTPIERDFEDGYNLGRVIFPSWMPTVARFKRVYCLGTDNFGNLLFNDSLKPHFATLFQKGIIRKRKTDPDVIEQFPKMIEKVSKVEMEPDQADFYESVTALFDSEDDDRSERQVEIDERRLWTLQRMTSGHPASHIHATNEMSRMIVEEVGEAGLRAIGSAKSRDLIERLRLVVKGQGEQVVVFSFFTSVIREVARELREAGFTVAEHHGGMPDEHNTRVRADFIAGNVEVLFTSDIGAKGLNLQNARYVIEYESALTYSNRLQRNGRVHRIVSDFPSVTCTTMVLKGTVEEDIFARTIDRNVDQDVLLGDSDDGSAFISAERRRAMLQAHRRKRK